MYHQGEKEIGTLPRPHSAGGKVEMVHSSSGMRRKRRGRRRRRKSLSKGSKGDRVGATHFIKIKGSG